MTVGFTKTKWTTSTFCARLPAFLVIIFALSLTTSGQSKPAESPSAGVIVDYTVATVNNQVITYSDVVWQLALQPNMPIEPPRADDLKRAFDLLIDQRLILQEADKLPQIHGEDKEVEAALAQMVRHFPSQDELRRRMTRVGLTSERLREIVHDRVDIEKYLDFRFRSFVVVTAKEVENYYREVYVPRFRTRTPGGIVPLLEKARAEIEQTLTEGKIESSMQDFLEDMRQRSDIVILRDFK